MANIGLSGLGKLTVGKVVAWQGHDETFSEPHYGTAAQDDIKRSGDD
ncbi:hypothetical protein [Edaphosphingomonas haloaromaticamans]|nr:hypothetical protein [Sphingomonas haloaromaticamans]